MTLIDLAAPRQWVSWMKIKRHIETFDDCPERKVLRDVQINGRVPFGYLRKSVDQSAFESELLHAASQFPDCGIRILHRKRCKCRETIRPLLNVFGENIVSFSRDLNCAFGIWNRLNGWGVQRDDHPLDSVSVHITQPLFLNVEEPALQFIPDFR